MKKSYSVAIRKAITAIIVMASPAAALAQQDSAYFVSDSTWTKSTVITPSTVLGYWSGVSGNLPAAATYTLPAPIGQPYGFNTIHPVDSADVIKTDNDITYFRKVISLDTLNDLTARIRINVDDHVEVYVNGMLAVGEYDAVMRTNWKNPPFDALFNNDESVVNGYQTGDAYDFTTTMDMDSLFVAGENEIIVVCRNLSGSTNKGGFSFRLDIKGTPGVPTKEFIVSDGFTFMKSTTQTQSSFNGNWDGVNGVYPAASTFTLSPTVGQPYSYVSLDPVPDATVIKTGNNISYYRTTFELTKKNMLNARFRMNVDDAMEIYINGFLVAREGSTSKSNWRTPFHDLKFNQDGSFNNGFMGGDMFDFVTFSSLSDIYQVGVNELVLVIRNQPKAGDAGGFSFRMDIDANGAPVIKKSAKVRNIPGSESNIFVAEVYPNPSNGWLNVAVEDGGNFDVMVYDMNGRLLTSVSDSAEQAGIDISAYAKGIYFVKVISGEQTYTAKVVKE